LCAVSSTSSCAKYCTKIATGMAIIVTPSMIVTLPSIRPTASIFFVIC
jgi:hypothetical protein